ncbi:ROK family glucokinase [Pseudalkalibacillus berkeleyi]|uniref:Glucokinase n=1 Tax=Pseudalkalibacillus berkeleyi TaxID=1069813 RepID=A0ABS9H1X0_9BACL|nr:ROK family glucokinase [Pseudalkalibacillus berkeleyi]MCF6137901.1 ROK family glucokinase [Pseudalkalibacillus berkeleyi]
MKERLSIGVDIGGTSIKLAVVDSRGNIVHKWNIRTDTSEKGRNISSDINATITETINQLNMSPSDIEGIGIGVPGFINIESGFIYGAINIGWENYPLKDDLEARSGYPVMIDNDANLAALGEMWKGAGNQVSNLICITLGTGIGGGIILNGQILHGVNGMAGEIGHITSIMENGAPCNCGKTGCLETIASATGISRIAAEGIDCNPDSALSKVLKENGQITSEDVFTATNQGDEWANEVIRYISKHLGIAIANMSNVLNPSRIVIGGGVSRAGDQLMTPLKEVFSRFALPRVSQGAEFAVASLGNDAGVIGAARLIEIQSFER